ncbi:DUF5916 domain-containing protein [Polyangium sp. 6x1]|nr:DUF5916 domain-containing protein [Polyangium sp. 6x1]
MSLLPALLAVTTQLATPHLTATRVPTPPVLDGRLDELTWKRAKGSDAFTQKLPTPGDKPRYRTLVRVVYDDEAVYVGIDCEQTDDEIIARLTRRDRQVEADAVTVTLDTRGDGRSALEFEVNAAGVLSDALRFNDTELSREWDEIWDARTARTPHGWSAEFKIPLRILRFRDLPSQSFGLQVRRRVSMLQEVDEWTFIPRDAGGEVSRYGKLDGLSGLRPKGALELRPFVVGALRYSESEAEIRGAGVFPAGSAGLDLKWHPSQSLTLDATIFPDFGQVEADQVVLNLSNFEQFFPERRPFFLEGADNLATPFQLVYTRRLGRAPGMPAVRDDEETAGSSSPATVYAAAKLSGELAEGVSAFELLGVTAPVLVDVKRGDGSFASRVAEPLAAFKVLRLRKDFGPRASLGFMATAKSRFETPNVYPTVEATPGSRQTRVLCPKEQLVAHGARCFHDAYVAGVDGRWRSPGGEYVISGQAIASLVHDGPPRTLRDGTVISSGDIGPAVQARVAKEGGKHWTFDARYAGHGRKVDYNDVGYMQRQNLHAFTGSVAYRTLDPWWVTLETRTFVDVFERDTLDWLTQERMVVLGNYTRWANFWESWAAIHAKPSRYDDREVGDGTALERAALFGGELWVATDGRRLVNGEAWVMVQGIETGINVQGDGRLSLRLLPQLDLDLIPAFQYTRGEPRFVTTIGAGHVFGRLRAQSLGLTMRATYTFTPRLSLQAYAQAFLEAQSFDGFTLSKTRGPGQVARLAKLSPFGSPLDEDPDWEGGSINANVVLRWEYRLGSTLFLVYTHAQGDGRAPLGRRGAGFDFGWLGPRASEETLLAKLSYWWG